MKKWIIGILVIIILFAVFWFAGGANWLLHRNNNTYQAVFLTNNQVYFGRLSFDDGWVKLTNVFYLQVAQPPATTGQTPDVNQQTSTQLVKLGSEPHGPEDAMYIEKDKILFWENMKPDSKVQQTINQYYTANPSKE